MELIAGFIYGAGFIIVLLALLVVGILSENNKPGRAFIVSIVVFAILTWAGYFSLGWIVQNPLSAFGIILAYLAVGVAWSFAKLRLFASHIAQTYSAAKEMRMAQATAGYNNQANWSTNRSKPSLDEYLKSETAKVREEVRRGYGLAELPPKASHLKSRIVSWMMYWPISFVWTFIADFVVNLFTHLFNRFRGGYDKLIRSTFQKVGLE